MLRAVRLKNVLKFEKDQYLKFSDGGNLFVGENGSGKSSVFESVRRCMDLKSNFIFSMNVPNEKDPSYVVCDFSLPEDIRDKFENHDGIITTFVQIPDSQSAKVVVITDKGKSENAVVYMDIIFKDNSRVCPSKHFQCVFKENEECTLIQSLCGLLTEEHKTSELLFLNTVSEIIKRSSKTITETEIAESSNITNEETKAESTLNTLSEHVVFTFACKAVGVQWSKSSSLRKAEENYSADSETCEIIRWFSERRHDIFKAEKIFQVLTGGEYFKFDLRERDGKELLLVRNWRGEKLNIFKLPNGILEAKLISLLLSYKPFRTILLEEPDRGMHPQMIQRLRLILTEEKAKSIIIISHNAAFISPLLIQRTFKFCKVSNQKTRDSDAQNSFEIVNIGNLSKQIRDPISRIATEKYANVIFTKRILFVEGKSDLIFSRAMFSYILNPETEDSSERIFNLVSELYQKKNGVPLAWKYFEKLKYLLSSLYILDCHGDKEKWHVFCDSVNTPHLFLLDANTVVETETAAVGGGNTAHVCASKIHQEVAELLKESGIEKVFSEKIADFLRKKFLRENPSILECETFPDVKVSTEMIVSTAQGINFKQENINMEQLFGGIDAKFYGNIYAKNVQSLKIQESESFRWKPVSKIGKSSIVPESGKIAFKEYLKQDWIVARNKLRQHDIFVWKDGSIEDAILDIILASKAGNAQTRTDEIFRKYLAFYSLKIDLPLESFHKRHGKTLYLGMCDEDIQSSIDLVFKFLEKDSDIVHFLHFLTMYAAK